MNSLESMKIVADENILLVKNAFAEFGEVKTVPGRKISREMLMDASILLVRSITEVNRELIEGTPVKFVATATIGTDHIDVNYLHDSNIGFAYAPASNADSVAQYVVAALLNTAKKKKVKLSDLTLGIIGAGNVGSRVFSCASTLGMKCLLNDPPKKRLTQSDTYVSLDKVLEEADVISVHVPLIASGEDITYKMINHDFLSKMKKNAVFINTSRGKVVDEKSLRASRPDIGTIILDVWDGEPLISIETMRVTDICTPHIAGYSYDGKLNGTQMIYDAACAFFFKSPAWNIPEEISREIVNEIDCTMSDDPVFDAVCKAYDIMNDDADLRKIADEPRETYGKYFDDLRKNYPRRYEFSHYKIKCKKSQSIAALQLSSLGFIVNVVSA